MSMCGLTQDEPYENRTYEPETGPVHFAPREPYVC